MTRKAHLLLVDDDANTLASLSRAFRLAGHEATVCDNAARAVELLRTEKFDLIFSDVVMPGKSGLEFLEEIKNAGVKVPVILISGQANIEMAVRATKLGALDFLEKPLSTDKLLVTVENALRLSRLEDENRELRRRLGKHQLVDATILRGQIWSPTQQGCRVPESPGSVNIRKLHLTYRFGRYAPPVGNLLPVPA